MKSRSAACAVVTLIACLAVAAAVVTLAGHDIDVRLAPLRFRASDPIRPLSAAAALALVVFALGFSSAVWRRTALSLAAVCGLLALPLAAVAAPQLAPVGDAAILEVHTRNALAGQQLLGPYSQYGWFHPGPMLFYWLAPFYAFSRESTSGVAVGALALNLVALALIGWLSTRRTHMHSPFACALWTLTAIYLWRLPSLATSAWNPHALALPFMAVVLAAGAVAASDISALPLLVVVASFVMQTHVGIVPAAAALTAIAVIRLAQMAIGDPDTRSRLWRWCLLSGVLLEVLWALPLAEEIVHRPGNLTLLWRFFMSPADTQPIASAWAAWASTLAGVFDPAFRLALGGAWFDGAPTWTPAVGTAIVLALIPAAMSKQLPRFVRSLAICALVASVAGLWSVFKIRGAIATYQVFWLSALGTVNASIAAAWIAAAVPRRIPTAGIGILVGRAVPIALVAFVAVRGVRAIAAGDTNDAITPEHHAVRALSDRIIEELAASGGRRPVVRIDPSVWGVGAGVVLQLAKASVPFGVDELAALFGAPLAANGSEDLLVVICGGQRHRELLEKPGVRQVGVYEHWYADFVPLAGSGRLD